MSLSLPKFFFLSLLFPLIISLTPLSLEILSSSTLISSFSFPRFLPLSLLSMSSSTFYPPLFHLSRNRTSLPLVSLTLSPKIFPFPLFHALPLPRLFNFFTSILPVLSLRLSIFYRVSFSIPPNSIYISLSHNLSSFSSQSLYLPNASFSFIPLSRSHFFFSVITSDISLSLDIRLHFLLIPHLLFHCIPSFSISSLLFSPLFFPFLLYFPLMLPRDLSNSF